VLSILRKDFGTVFPPDLVHEFKKANHDILRPTGDYVGIKATPDDARSEEEPNAPTTTSVDVDESQGAATPTSHPVPPPLPTQHDMPQEVEATNSPTPFPLNQDDEPMDVDSETFQSLSVRNRPKREPLMHLRVWRRCGGGRGEG
jgi:hypothetical protein